MHDFRSDTVTRPTPAMRQAMAEAEVGDDVLEVDPTVAKLQEEAAQLFGREAALFVPSGSMGNQIAARLHARSGEEVALGDGSHSFDWEMGALAALSGLQARPLPAPRGRVDVEAARAALRPAPAGHRPACRLLIVENTHNFHGGAVVPLDHLQALRSVCRERDAALHLDGARLWNAAAATDTPLPAYGAVADSLMVCLSKGLCAPVGSLLIGDRELVERARHVRKLFGGGMRQVGVLAAPARIALAEMRGRLGDDHARAARLAAGLQRLPGVTLPLGAPDTNIVFATFAGRPASELVAALERNQVRAIATGPATIRFVTHHGVGDEGVDAALAALESALAA